MPLLRSRSAVRRARWAFMKVFFALMGIVALVFTLVILARVFGERLLWE